MKGIVFTNFLDMLDERHSPELTEEVLGSVELPSGGVYTAIGTYDSAELVALIGAVSRRTGTPAGELVRDFGVFLFGRFIRAFPELFDGVRSALDFLERVESVVHIEVVKLYPDAELPTFRYDRPDREHLVIHYRSQRPFGDLAEGLIHGCLAHYGERAAVTREDRGDGSVVFDVRVIAA